MNTNPIQYIDTPAALEQLCQQLHDAPWIALDTEFLREKTYYPQLCLLQLGTTEITACIDPLALPNLDPLLPLFDNPNITKIFHAGSQDLEILFQLNGRLPSPLFDTQIAAPLLGHNEQIGYANLVNEVLGVQLEKAHSRADWTRRPLPEAQINYAADDVIYLGQIYKKLQQQLQQKDRLQWLDDDFQALTDTGRYQIDPNTIWQKLRGLERLKGESLSIAQQLCIWREEQAQKKNLPRKWLLKDEVVLDLALQKPNNQIELGHIRGLTDRFVKQTGKVLLKLLSEARQQQPQPLPAFMKKKRPKAEHEAVADLLMAMVRQRAEEQSLNPNVITQRKELLKFIQGETDLTLLSGWRNKMIGADLQALLNGTANLSVKGGKLTLNRNPE
ncbi:MAG: ribonuclease D [Gammaproteobacteria bacterium]|nr:ribonuclease D [Gammaproteobacteria bacterium]